MTSVIEAHRKYTMDDKFIQLDPQNLKNFGLITGTYIGAMGGKSPYSTRFIASCSITALYREDLSGKPAIKAGQALEKVLLDYVNKISNVEIIPAEELGQDKKGDHNSWRSDFDHPIFGGHVDAITSDGRIVEVKTTTNPTLWTNGQIPEYYHLQASLYAVLSGVEDIIFIVGFLDTEDVSDPSRFRPTADNVLILETKLHPEIKQIMDESERYYKDYILKGKIPIPANPSKKEQEVIDILKAQLEENLTPMVQEYESLVKQLEELKPIEERAAWLKDAIKLNMLHNNISEATSSTNAYYISESVRTTVDTDALKQAGIYDRYSKETFSKQLKIKKLKGSEY